MISKPVSVASAVSNAPMPTPTPGEQFVEEYQYRVSIAQMKAPTPLTPSL